jgi:hypothetical protein
MSTGVAAGLLVLNVVATIWLLGHTIIRTERSRFRRTIWEIRDGLVSAIVDGRVRTTEPIVFEVRQLETLIAGTEVLTPFRYLVAARAAHNRVPRLERPSLEVLNAAENAVLREAQAEAMKATVRVIATGSPSGWLLGALAPIAGPILARADRRRAAKSPVIEEHTLPGFDKPHKDSEAESPVEEVAGWSAAHLGSPTDVVRQFTMGSRNHHALS